jgi:GntR family transcriptional regulator
MPTLRAMNFEAIEPGAAGMPLYRAVKRALVQAIERGQVAPGQALPAETLLAGAMRVSVGTLRHAVDELVHESVLVRRQGRGTFVATHTRDRFLFQFFHIERFDGLLEVPTVELLSFNRVRLDDEDASQALGLGLGEPVLCIENRLSLQGRPVLHDALTLPQSVFRGLTEKRFRERASTIYHLYQSEFGVSVVRTQERVRAVACERAVARHLGLSAGSPMLQLRRRAIALNGRVVEWRVSTVHTAHHEYLNTLSRSES